MEEWIAKIAVAFICDAERRRKTKSRIRSWLYGRKLRRKARLAGDVWCGGPVRVYCDKVELGEHVCFNGASLLGRGRIRIGRYFHSGFGLVIMTENHEYEGKAIPYDETFRVKDVTIGDFAWLGINVTILPGTRIGRGAIIQAGSVVHGEIPDYAIAGGNPAKVFAYRNKERFEKLAAAGAFH